MSSCNRSISNMLLSILGLLKLKAYCCCILKLCLSTLFTTPTLKRNSVPLSLQHNWCYQTLHFRSLKLLLLPFFNRKWTLNDILTYIVLLGQIVELSYLRCSLRTESSRKCFVSKSWNFCISFLNDCYA